ncbi:FAD-dependent monooxygenase [Nakamurella deserti]|uniref:FAD-dependent monooxygenase n=1 Tax=Nakamurella deserti TaxID=2164074 RepID=UPI000DBEA70F|nr:FAD-dependent monooxygenase [Nakamurella deserti]
MTTTGALDTSVLIAGAGPVGLMTAVELRRRGIDVIVLEPRLTVAPWAKAVGVQPRTLELWDGVGVARDALDAGMTMHGQLAFQDGEPSGRIDLTLPDDVPYRFIALPQYETERILGARLRESGTDVRRGWELVDVAQDDSGVTATVRSPAGETSLRAAYLVGCDGAHSRVRKSLGLSFDGAAFAEEYMLADVEVDWDLPTGYGVRSLRRTDGSVDDILVGIPLPGHKRYRMSMLVPDELRTAPADGGLAHGLEGGRAPELHHIQAVLDRLSPRPTTASAMRWSSVFRISHRIVDRYSVGRVFVAGDAAHIHPPTGAQGMNTGIQDACNLGWKLAAAVRGRAAAGLLDSYHDERHPIGEEVVGRTVRAARTGIGTGETLSFEQIVMREAQLLLGYPESALSAADVDAGWFTGGPAPGLRAPDAGGLRQDPVGAAFRWHELMRHPGHTLLLWVPDADGHRAALDAATEIARATAGDVRSRVVVARGVEIDDVSGITFRDASGTLAAAYGFAQPGRLGAYLVRPDGYVGYRTASLDVGHLLTHLQHTFVVAQR